MDQTTNKKTLITAGIICFLASSFINYEFVLRVLPSVMTTPLMHDLHTNAGGIGLLSSGFFISYGLMQIPAGMLYDAFDAKKVISLALITAVLGAILFAFSHSLTSAFISRIIIGMGSSFAVVGTFLLISRWFQAKYFSFVAGLVQLIASLGGILGQGPIASILSTGISWRELTLYIAGIGMILAIIYFLFIAEAPKGHFINHRTPSLKKSLLSIKHISLRPQNWLIAISMIFSWAPMSIFASLWGIPFLSASYNITTTHATEVMSTLWIGFAVGCPSIGWIARTETNKWRCLFVIPIITALTSLAIVYNQHVSLSLISLFIFILGFCVGTFILLIDLIVQIQPEDEQGVSIACINASSVIPGALFNPILGYIIYKAWNGAMQNGAPIYSADNYRVILISLPILALLMFINSFFLHHSYKKARVYESESASAHSHPHAF